MNKAIVKMNAKNIETKSNPIVQGPLGDSLEQTKTVRYTMK